MVLLVAARYLMELLGAEMFFVHESLAYMFPHPSKLITWSLTRHSLQHGLTCRSKVSDGAARSGDVLRT